MHLGVVGVRLTRTASWIGCGSLSQLHALIYLAGRCVVGVDTLVFLHNDAIMCDYTQVKREKRNAHACRRRRAALVRPRSRRDRFGLGCQPARVETADLIEAAERGLRMLLRTVSVPVVADGREALQHRTPAFLSPQDIRHEQNSRIQTLLTEIRTMPGLDRFMLGHTYEQLQETASKHPVVALVAARGQAYALIIPDSEADSPHPLALAITSDKLSSLRDYAARAGLRNGQSPDHMDEDARLGIVKPVKKDASVAVLSDLWLHVVKPVLDYLQLQVCADSSFCLLHCCR
jgi:hypothetical protein